MSKNSSIRGDRGSKRRVFGERAQEKGRPGKGLRTGACLGHKGAKSAAWPAARKPGKEALEEADERPEDRPSQAHSASSGTLLVLGVNEEAIGA